jgi:hypothetical protein
VRNAERVDHGDVSLKEADMYAHDGWDWLWMTFAMGFWLIALGVIVYVAVRLAQRDRRSGS